MDDWKAVGVVIEGEPIDLFGLNPWEFEWRRLAVEPIELPHPSYPSQQHRMLIYEIGDGNSTVRFATAELSANVWGFYLPAAQ